MLNDLTAQNEKYILQKEKQLLKNLQNEHFSLFNYNNILQTSTNRAKSKDFPMKIINSPVKSVNSKEKVNISYISTVNNKNLDKTNINTTENVLSLPKIPKYKSRQVSNHNYNQYTHFNRQTTLEINKNEEETKKTSRSPKKINDEMGNSNLFLLKNLFDEQNFILKEYKDTAFRLIKERNEYLIEANRLKDIIDYKKIESVNCFDKGINSQNLNRSLFNDNDFVSYMNLHIDKRISNRLLANNHSNHSNVNAYNAYNANRIRSVSEEVDRKFEGNKLKVIRNHGLYINSIYNNSNSNRNSNTKIKTKEKSILSENPSKNMTFFEKKQEFKIEKQLIPTPIPTPIPVYKNINTQVSNEKTIDKDNKLIRDSSVKSLSKMMNIIINNSQNNNNTNDDEGEKVIDITKSSNFNSLKSINTSKFHDLNKSNEQLMASQLSHISRISHLSHISLSKNTSQDKENKEIIQEKNDNHDKNDKKIYKKIKIIPISLKPLQINKLKDQRSIIKSDKSSDQSSNQSRSQSRSKIFNLNKEESVKNQNLIYNKIKISPKLVNKSKDEKEDKKEEESKKEDEKNESKNEDKDEKEDENEKEKKKISDVEYEKVMKLLNGIKQNVKIINKTEQDLNEINKTNKKRKTIDVSRLYKKSNTIKINKDLFNNSSNI